MYQTMWRKVSTAVLVFLMVLLVKFTQPLFAETTSQLNPDGSKTITTTTTDSKGEKSTYRWTVNKDGKTVKGERPGGEDKAKKDKEKMKVKKNKQGDVVEVEGPSVKEGVTNYIRLSEGHETAKKEAYNPSAGEEVKLVTADKNNIRNAEKRDADTATTDSSTNGNSS